MAIPCLRERIAPVFDWAHRILFVDLRRRTEIGRELWTAADATLGDRANRLAELGVDLLACGGITFAARALLTFRCVDVIAWLAGDAEEVLTTFRERRPITGLSSGPGCQRALLEPTWSRTWDRLRQGASRPVRTCLCPVCGLRGPQPPGVSCGQSPCPRCHAPRMYALSESTP